MELVTAHFWVNDSLYEVDYDKADGPNGAARFFKVHRSERRCQCRDREALECLRQAQAYTADSKRAPVAQVDRATVS